MNKGVKIPNVKWKVRTKNEEENYLNTLSKGLDLISKLTKSKNEPDEHSCNRTLFVHRF